MMIIELLEISYSSKISKPPSYTIKYVCETHFVVGYLVEEFENLLDAMLKIHEIVAYPYSSWAIPQWIPTKKYYSDLSGIVRWRLINKFSIQDQKLTVLYTVKLEDKF